MDLPTSLSESVCVRVRVGCVGLGEERGSVYMTPVHRGALTACGCIQKCWFLSVLILPHALGLSQQVVCKLLEAFCDLSGLLSGRTTAKMARFCCNQPRTPPSLRDLSLEPEDVLLVTFPLTLVLYALAVAVVYCSSYVDSQWAEELKDRELSGKGLERFVWGKISRREMILITLDSKKVYAGWPLEIPDDETKQWLRFAPEWSGYRDDKSATIHIETDYSEVFNQSQLEKNHMLVQVEKIVTLQPFDIDAFQQFNLEELPESN